MVEEEDDEEEAVVVFEGGASGTGSSSGGGGDCSQVIEYFLKNIFSAEYHTQYRYNNLSDLFNQHQHGFCIQTFMAKLRTRS